MGRAMVQHDPARDAVEVVLWNRAVGERMLLGFREKEIRWVRVKVGRYVMK